MLTEAQAQKLTRYHETLSRARWPRDLVKLAHGWMTSNHVPTDHPVYAEVYRAHKARVMGMSSPQEADDSLQRLIREWQPSG